MDRFTEDLYELVQQFSPGAVIRHHEKLTGGVSADNTLLVLGLPDGQEVKLVLRVHGSIHFETNPDIALDQYRLYQELNRTRCDTIMSLCSNSPAR